MKQFPKILLLAIILCSAQAEESENDLEDCSRHALIGTLTVGMVLYYLTLPLFWLLSSSFSLILGPFYAPISSIFGFIFPFASYVYLVGLLVPNEEIIMQVRSAATKIFTSQEVSFE